MKTKPLVNAVTGALMLTKRPQLPHHDANDLTPGTKCIPLPSVFFVSCQKTRSITVSGWTFICSFMFFWDRRQPFVSAVFGALMLTKRLQFRVQHAVDLTPGTKCRR